MSKLIPIDSPAIEWQFIRSTGPGGQHVNKSSTAVQLRLHLRKVTLPHHTMKRLREQNGSRISSDDILTITASVHRSQKRNRVEAHQRLVKLLEKASHRPKYRVATRPSRRQVAKRLDNKKRNSQKKKSRSQKWD